MKLDESRDVRVLWTRTKMAAEEKTVSVDAPDVKPSSQPPVPSTGEKKPEPSSEKKPGPAINVGVVKFAVKYLKFVGVALGIWFMGWLGLSYVWVLCGLMIFMIWRLNKDEKKKKRSSLQEAADNEDGAVSAKMEDLPAWVSFLNHETNFLVNTRQHKKTLLQSLPRHIVVISQLIEYRISGVLKVFIATVFENNRICTLN